MEEKRTAGGKEFFTALVWVIILFTASQYISSAFTSYHIAAAVISILMFCVLGFFVLTRYCAVFTYAVKDGRVRINRFIGHRNKEVDFAVDNIKSITAGKPKSTVKNAYNMTTKVFSKKGVYCIVYDKSGYDEAVLFEPSREMLDYIKQMRKGITAEK